jgi:hypothetical protein
LNPPTGWTWPPATSGVHKTSFLRYKRIISLMKIEHLHELPIKSLKFPSTKTNSVSKSTVISYLEHYNARYLRPEIIMYIREGLASALPNPPQNTGSSSSWDLSTIANIIFGIIMVFVGIVAIWQGRHRRIVALDGT